MQSKPIVAACIFALVCLQLAKADDVNECTASPCDSDAYCMNTHGSFVCWCPRGYRSEGTECKAETPHSIEMSLMVRGVDQADLYANLEMFTWLFASTLTSENPAQVAYTSIVDTMNTPWGTVVTINAMLNSGEEGVAAVARFYSASPSFQEIVQEKLGMHVVHYGKALTPAEREYKASGPGVVSMPTTFEIDSVNLGAYQVIHTADTTIQYLEVTFTPDADCDVPEEMDFLSSIRVGSGDDIAAVNFFDACDVYLADAGAQAAYAEVLGKPCAPNISAAAMCDLAVSHDGSDVTFYVPVLPGMFDADDSKLHVQFDVSMASPSTGIVYTLPVGESVSLSSVRSFCSLPPQDEETEPQTTQGQQPATPSPTEGRGDSEPATTADADAEDDESNATLLSFGASYNADAEILQPAPTAAESDAPELPTMAVGSGAAVVFVVVASGAAVVVRRRKVQKRSQRDSPGTKDHMWIADLNTQVTSDFMLASAADSKERGFRDHAASDLRAVEHLNSGVMTRRDMSHRIAGHRDEGATVCAVVCVDDGKREARFVNSCEAPALSSSLEIAEGAGSAPLERKRRGSASLA